MWGHVRGQVLGKLTVLQVKAAKLPGRYSDGQGLMLQVKPSGARSWVVRVQVNGKRRDFGLGSANDITLSEARESAAATRKLFRAGNDPVAAKRASQAASAAIPSFREAAERAHADQKSGWRNLKHQAQWLSSLEAYAFPSLGQLRVDEVDAAMIGAALTPIWLSKPETARRVRQRITAVLDWAHGKGLRASEAPTRSIGKLLPRQPKRDGHFAAMPYSELASFMEALTARDTMGRLALRFLILTACRSGEVRGATWDEIDLSKNEWTIPAGRMKAGKAHIVPLSKAAVNVLTKVESLRTTAGNQHIFPGLRGKQLSDMTLTKVLRSAEPTNATVHGFRSSFRDWAAECTQISGEVVEAALAHTNSNRVEAAYRRTNYLEKRRPLMERWAEYVCTVTSSRDPVSTPAAA